MNSAEREGFEPPEPRGSTVFKTAAIDHSAIFPAQRYYLKSFLQNTRRSTDAAKSQQKTHAPIGEHAFQL